MEKSFFKKSWPLLSLIVLVGWSLLFWHLFIIEWSAKKVNIPIGAGGAIYFIFFIPPVLIGSAIYQLILYRIFPEISFRKWIGVSIILPLGIISILILAFCPTESDLSYIEHLWKIFTG